MENDYNDEIAEVLASGFGIMREEERLGKWIGFVLAVVFWVIVSMVYISTRKPVGYFECDNGDLIPFDRTMEVIKVENRRDWEIQVKGPSKSDDN